MNKTFVSALAATGLLLAIPAAAQQKTVVSFAKGASSATKAGTIKGSQDATYLVDARAGQTMTVTLKTTKGSPYMNITAPGAAQAMFIGSSDGARFSGTIPSSGRYAIQVYQMRATARRNETASYTLTIAVSGGATAAAPKPSRDALVAGTNYNATAEIPCISSAGAAKTRCKAGVMRMAGGESTVDIKTADGGQRYIYFKNGRPSSSDANAPMRVTRQGDVSIIRIGSVEVYEIPDAFVVGG